MHVLLLEVTDSSSLRDWGPCNILLLLALQVSGSIGAAVAINVKERPVNGTYGFTKDVQPVLQRGERITAISIIY